MSLSIPPPTLVLISESSLLFLHVYVWVCLRVSLSLCCCLHHRLRGCVCVRASKGILFQSVYIYIYISIHISLKHCLVEIRAEACSCLSRHSKPQRKELIQSQVQLLYGSHYRTTSVHEASTAEYAGPSQITLSVWDWCSVEESVHPCV